MNRKMPIFDDFCFLKGKTELHMPLAGDPCTLFCDPEEESKYTKISREDQYLKKIKDAIIIEEDRHNHRLLLLKQELQAYFEARRKFKL